nr:hypothetical protein [Vibrio ziniensis]
MRGTSQQGLATLMITSVLLMAALVITMGTYKNLFYQIKRAQNEVKARQHHWHAEGVLECTYTQFRHENKRPLFISDCGSGYHSTAMVSDTSNGWIVTATSGYSSLQKEISANCLKWKAGSWYAK